MCFWIEGQVSRMRLIDADDFMNRMYHECFVKDNPDMHKWDSGCWLRYKLLETVMRQQPTVHPEPEWISCEVRMPEEHDSIFAKFKGTDRWQKIMWEKQSEKVLVTVEYEDGTRAVEVANTFDGKWKYKTAVVDRYPVAWCPFPEPYKPKETE